MITWIPPIPKPPFRKIEIPRLMRNQRKFSLTSSKLALTIHFAEQRDNVAAVAHA